jgi:pyruvate kinase
MERLIRSGMNVARFNLSHGSYNEHTGSIRRLRQLSQRLGISVAILIDLPGPKYRTGKLKDGQTILRRGTLVTFTPKPIEGDATLVPVNLPYLSQDIKRGDLVLVDDGAIQLKALEIVETDVKCRVIVGGVLTEGRGLVVPGRRTSGPFINEALREHIMFAISQQPDYVAISFISDAEEVNSVRRILERSNGDIPIIAKIEKIQAVKNFVSILAASDGIMVARGDLGVDMPLEKVPLVQKEIIYRSNRAGKPVITATQMLESMVKATRPTRAEASDVVNAILDGTDAIMLSEETAIGEYPVQTVQTMAKIAREAEKSLLHKELLRERESWVEPETDELIAYNACHTAQSLGAVAIVALTSSGSTAARVSKYRPRMPILAMTHNKAIAGRLLLRWGVMPVRIAPISSVDELFATGARLCKEMGLAKPGDLIIITGGIPFGTAGTTNLLKVELIG